MTSMHLALFLDAVGTHYAGWRYPDAKSTGPFDFAIHKELAQKAEKAKFDMVFMADKLSIADTFENDFKTTVTYSRTGYPEPLTLMAALATVTEKIGIAGTVSSSFLPPFLVARMLASMDHLSGGRIGWNVVPSTSDGEAYNFNSKEPLLDYERRYDKVEEFIRAVKVLWDTWEDDALIMNKETGIFADANKIHYANFEGEFFNIRGPLNTPRPVQGHPVTIQPGGSSSFIHLASKTADAVFIAEQPSLGAAQDFYQRFKAQVVENGRNVSEVKVLPGLSPIIGRTEKEAQEKLEVLKELHHPLMTFTHLSSTMNYDWSQHDLDDLVPNILDKIERKERFANFIHHAVNNKMTLRQFAKWVASSGQVLAGTPSSIADHMTRFYKEKAVDGFILMPAYIPGGADDIFECIVPELQERGVFRTEYEGATLRNHLGLNRPENNIYKATSI